MRAAALLAIVAALGPLTGAAAHAQTVVAVPAQSSASTTSGSTRSAVQRESFAEGRISVAAWSPWPAMLYQGYFPIAIEIENHAGSDVEVDVELSRGWGVDDVLRVGDTLEVPAGERVRREFLLSASRVFTGGVNLELACRGEERRIFGVGPNAPPDTSAYPVLYAYDPAASAIAAPSAGAEEAWSQAAAAAPPAVIPEFDTGSQTFDAWNMHGPRMATATAAKWHPQFSSIELGELSARSEAYSSLKGVVLDVRGALPRAEVLEALLQWTRLGGCLVVHGPDARRVAGSIPSLAGWMEERFLLWERAPNVVYACAQGALVLVEGPLLTEHAAARPELGSTFSAINAGLVHPRQLFRSPSMWGPLEGVAALPGMALPYRGFAVLLVLFALAIGPVNLIVIRKLKRPALLLVTVPAIALLFSLGLVLYGILAQGLGTRARSLSFTWLDQRAHHASTLEVRSSFAGLPHGEGWRAGPGTSVHSLPDASRRMSSGALRVDAREGTAYRGDFLPVRREVRNAFLTDRAARARLELRGGASGLEVENGLGVAIERLFVRAADGRDWFAPSSLAPGARAALKPLKDGEQIAFDELSGAVAVFPSRKALVPGSYVAQLSRSPFTDDCGVAYDEEDSRHVVYGVLDAPAREEPR